jgi:hypothetical protein
MRDEWSDVEGFEEPESAQDPHRRPEPDRQVFQHGKSLNSKD